MNRGLQYSDIEKDIRNITKIIAGLLWCLTMGRHYGKIMRKKIKKYLDGKAGESKARWLDKMYVYNRTISEQKGKQK